MVAIKIPNSNVNWNLEFYPDVSELEFILKLKHENNLL